MGKIINLRAAKKAKDRAEGRAQGAVNAAKFGRSKDERMAQKTRSDKASAQLDAHLRETP